MAGLMDFINSPSIEGLAEGLLQSSGYSPIPITNGQALGAGLAQSMAFARNAAALKHQKMANEMQNAQLGIYQNVIPKLIHDLSPKPAHTQYDLAVTPFQGNSEGNGIHVTGGEPIGYQQHVAAGVNPAGLDEAQMLGPFLHMNFAPAVKNMMEFNPHLQGEIQRAKSMAQNPIAIDNAMANQAAERGNLEAANQYRTKAAIDSGQLNISDWNGALSHVSVGPDGQVSQSTLLPKTGIFVNNGHESVVPGALNAQRNLRYASSLGEGVGRAQTAMTTAYGKHGAGHPISEAQAMWGGFSPFPSVMLHGSPMSRFRVGQGTSEQQGNAPVIDENNPNYENNQVVTQLSPENKAFGEGKGKAQGDYYQQVQEAAQNAKDRKALLETTIGVVKQIPTGAYAKNYEKLLSLTNSLLPSGDRIHEKTLKGFEVAEKNLQRNFMAGMRTGIKGQEKASMFERFKNAFENISMQPGSLGFLLSADAGQSDYEMARREAISKYAENHGNLDGFQDEWIKQQNPISYSLHSMLENGYSSQAKYLLHGLPPKSVEPILQGMYAAANATGDKSYLDSVKTLVDMLPTKTAQEILKMQGNE